MSFLDKAINHITKRKFYYGGFFALLIFFSLKVFESGKALKVNIPTESVFGIGAAGVNVGAVFILIGALFIFLFTRKRTSKKSLGILLLGLGFLISGLLISGSSAVVQLVGFLGEIGLLGQIIFAFVVFVIFAKLL